MISIRRVIGHALEPGVGRRWQAFSAAQRQWRAALAQATPEDVLTLGGGLAQKANAELRQPTAKLLQQASKKRFDAAAAFSWIDMKTLIRCYTTPSLRIMEHELLHAFQNKFFWSNFTNIPKSREPLKDLLLNYFNKLKNQSEPLVLRQLGKLANGIDPIQYSRHIAQDIESNVKAILKLLTDQELAGLKFRSLLEIQAYGESVKQSLSKIFSPNELKQFSQQGLNTLFSPVAQSAKGKMNPQAIQEVGHDLVQRDLYKTLNRWIRQEQRARKEGLTFAQKMDHHTEQRLAGLLKKPGEFVLDDVESTFVKWTTQATP